MRNLVVKNDGSKLCRQLLSLVDFFQGNNYPSTHINVRVYKNHIVVSTFYVNSENLDSWDNENYTTVERAYVPHFTAKKLGIV
jgi:hypothetical protein